MHSRQGEMYKRPKLDELAQEIASPMSASGAYYGWKRDKSMDPDDDQDVRIVAHKNNRQGQ